MMRLIMNRVILIICLLVFSACKIEPVPITYGNDVCQFCSMTIVDKQHASELVTSKGKVYKFDAIECLLNYRKEIDHDEVALYLCNHFTKPGELISMEEATFLISEGIPSPMGAYLTAFESKEAATEAKNEYGGTLYSWITLLEQ